MSEMLDNPPADDPAAGGDYHCRAMTARQLLFEAVAAIGVLDLEEAAVD